MVKAKRRIVLVIHNVRSIYNVGSLLRTAEGLGVNKVYLTGYTPYPEAKDDVRLPHLRQKQALQIHKTALGAENFVDWRHEPNVLKVVKRLDRDGFLLLALEQTAQAGKLGEVSKLRDVALFVGNELTGLDQELLRAVRHHVQIPMRGRKESFNVTVAASIALYHLKYLDKINA